MKVEAVSGIGFRNSNINFGEKQRVHEGAPVSRPSGVSDLAKVPVIVLLAMNPATLNSAIPMMPETDNPDKIVMLAPETKSADAATYVIEPEIQLPLQADQTYGWGMLSKVNILHERNAYVNGVKYHLVYATAGKNNKKDVTDVYLFKDGSYSSKDPSMPPPRIIKLVYHNIGDGKEFLGAVVYEEVVDKSGNYKGTMKYELKLDDDSATHLINFCQDKTSMKNSTQFYIVESESPKLMPLKVY